MDYSCQLSDQFVFRHCLNFLPGSCVATGHPCCAHNPARRDSRILLNTQGRITYSLPSKKGLLITSPGIYENQTLFDFAFPEAFVHLGCNVYKGPS